MKQNQISDPNVFEIFSINSQTDIIDTDQVAWNSCDLLQRAMVSFQPTLFQPEVLIKLANESSLIRTRIEELDIEERRDSTVLHAELWNLDESIKKTLATPDLVQRAIAIERRTGKLQAVMITARTIPRNFSIRLLNKICDEKRLKKRSLFIQDAARTGGSLNPLNTSDEGIHRLLHSVKDYLEKQISSETHETEEKQIIKRQNSQVPIERPGSITTSRLTNKSIALNQALSAPPAPAAATGEEAANNSPVVVHSRFRNKSEAVRSKRSDLADVSSIDPETGEVDWLQSGQQMNWKERKNKDRTIVELTEQIIKLPKKPDAPTREMTISYLASLSKLQLEFMEDLIRSLLPSSELKDPQEHVIQQKANPGLQNSRNAAQNEMPAATASVKDNSETKNSELIKVVKESENFSNKDYNHSKSELEEFKGISSKEMELHQKILETQKEFNVTYDHAAGMVLK